MVVDHLNNGLWALLSAGSYYRALPGTTHTASDEILVLVRDLGAARLTLAVLLTIAAVLVDRRVLLVALAVAAFAGLVRLVAHLVGDSNAEWFNWIGYALGAGLPVALIALVRSSNTGSFSADTYAP
jgi:hypothetical protein